MDKDYLTTNEVCSLFKVTRQTVYNWSSEKVLTKYKIGGKNLYKASEIEQLLQSSKQ